MTLLQENNTFKARLTSFLYSYKTISIITALLCLFFCVQLYMLGTKMSPDGEPMTRYNNYVIFKYSFFHLINGQDLYAWYPKEHWDLYKYSPTFSLFFVVFAYFPDIIGMSLWNLLNAFVLLWAIKILPSYFSNKHKTFIAWFVLIELLGSQQNCQSNTLLAGLVIAAFALAEKEKYFWSMLLIILSGYIKIYGLVGLVIYLFYPQKLRNIAYFIFWSAVLFFLPLLVTSFQQLLFQYKSWGNLLAMDHSASLGWSVYAWLQSWFHLNIDKNIVLVIGMIVFLLPLLRFRKYNNVYFKIWMLASVLIWMVIFNHKAESPTFIIPVAGVALWYFIQQPSNVFIKILYWSVFVFTMLSQTDLFPRFVKDNYFHPYVIKAVPCIFVWFVLSYQLLFNRFRSNLISTS